MSRRLQTKAYGEYVHIANNKYINTYCGNQIKMPRKIIKVGSSAIFVCPTKIDIWQIKPYKHI